MPNNSIADVILDWEKLIATVKASAAEAPGLNVHIPPLEQLLEEARVISARLETQKGIKQQMVQERKALLKKGQALASRARAALKAHFGLDNERLVEFGANPIRPRPRASKKPPAQGSGTPAPPPTVEGKPNDKPAPPATTTEGKPQ
ncbi:MAG TPA: hypothetical protein VGG03_02320 [Thermoanaerobaculia bacterium]|jgi:hypothetical protein